jgi:heparosan-N-sulfate-glucuronate 5-epimerase
MKALFARQSLDVGRLPVGGHVAAEAVRGYYIDFREKTTKPTWPPEWFPWPGFHRFMAISQWGLGCYERYLSGEGEEWLAAALAAGQHLAGEQGPTGGWAEPNATHTYRLHAPWLSAMAQGQCSSLLTRLSLETGSEELGASARRGLAPMQLPSAGGGVASTLQGGPFLEEYPTEPPSFVLNGAIFAAWGVRDVAVGLSDADAASLFSAVVETLARTVGRWDTGYWSLYDLYPHRVRNVASPFYHALHARQLRLLAGMTGQSELQAVAERFEAYARLRRNRTRALAEKVAFRLLVPHRSRAAVQA